MAAQAGLCLAWFETPEDTFCRVVAPIELKRSIYVKFLGISVRQNMIELYIQSCFYIKNIVNIPTEH